MSERALRKTSRATTKLTISCAALAMSESEVAPSAGLGLPADFQGKYELFAVVTHKGRDSDGGHYMGWVRQNGEVSLIPSPLAL